MAHCVFPVLSEKEVEDKKFEVILTCVVGLNLADTMWDPDSKRDFIFVSRLFYKILNCVLAVEYI